MPEATTYYPSLVEFGNFWYFFFLFLMAGITVGSVLLCRKLGQKFAHRYILCLLWGNFALHFLKQFLPTYLEWLPQGLCDSLFPNLCAWLIFFGPFIYMFGNKHFKDYLFYIGLISGVAVYLMPTGAIRHDLPALPYATETARFYLCHLPLVVVPLVMVDQRLHRLDWKRLWSIPLIYGLALTFITAHVFLFGPILKFDKFPHEWIGPNGVLNRFAIADADKQIANQSMQFGPQPSTDKILSWIYPYLIPGLMTFHYDGVLYFTPVIWILPFIAIATCIVGPFMTLPFEHKAMKLDILAWRQKRKMRKLHAHQRDIR